MNIKKLGRAVVISTAAIFAITAMSGAFALPPVQDEFQQCLDNATGGDIENVDVAKRISCCKQAGGSWVELYDADGNVVDAFCDGAEEVYEPEESQAIRQINPALINTGLVLQPAADPTPAPAAATLESRTDGTAASTEVAATDPSAAPAQPAAETPSKDKKKHRRHHHRRAR